MDQVRDGVSTFDINRYTCLQTDWSREGVGYLLLQKHCDCCMEKAPVCCPGGWQLIFAGSRFTLGAESRYAPTEGEALAVAWALEHSRLFTLGCTKLLVSTDHRPLLGILNDRNLDDIKNPRLCRLKEKCLPFQFHIQYNPGKWHRGPDALSRGPTTPDLALGMVCSTSTDTTTSELSYTHSALVDDIDTIPVAQVAAINASYFTSADVSIIYTDELKTATKNDSLCQELTSTILRGFPLTRHLTPPLIREFWSVRENLWISNDIIMYNDRIVIPTALRPRVLASLHGAHQGVSSMRSRANETVYWPGLNADLRNTRYNCRYCNEISPSQPREPLILTPQPSYPFQHICADFFHVAGDTYISVVDRFSGWPIIHCYGRQHVTAERLIELCRAVFATYGVPESISTDGGPQFASIAFKQFLLTWNVAHRISSPEYAQSNGRAELGVKAAKRILLDNTGPNGSINTDHATRALLMYRNTPIQHLGLSPAQILFHRSLRDCVPIDGTLLKPHHSWIDAAAQRERAFMKRNEYLLSEYNRTAHQLPPLKVGSTVLLQNRRGQKYRWDRAGIIVETLSDRKYLIKLHGSGRVVTRNRRFVRASPPILDESLLSYPRMVYPDINNPDVSLTNNVPNTSISVADNNHSSSSSPALVDRQTNTKLAAPLRRLLPHNSAGLKEAAVTQSRLRQMPRTGGETTLTN